MDWSNGGSNYSSILYLKKPKNKTKDKEKPIGLAGVNCPSCTAPLFACNTPKCNTCGAAIKKTTGDWLLQEFKLKA